MHIVIISRKRICTAGRKIIVSARSYLEIFIKQYIEAQQVPVVTFVWQGGEPTLLGIDYFRRAVELQKKYANGKTIENAFQTNGTNLNTEWCRFFADNKMLVGISIDGEEHNHDKYRRTVSGAPTFRRVMKGIELLHRNSVEFNTLSCVNSYNVNYASETYKFLKHIGSGFIQFLPVVERMSLHKKVKSLSLVPPGTMEDAFVTDWSVPAVDYGGFLITIFNEWVRNDVARYLCSDIRCHPCKLLSERCLVCAFSPKHVEMPWLWNIMEISFPVTILYTLTICLGTFFQCPCPIL